MSDLNPGFITLNQGLDLQSPKIAAPPGTLLDSLNYEQVDFQGQKRIDGYVRYDGSLGSYQDDLYVLGLSGMDTSPGDLIYNSNDELVGVTLAVQEDSVTIALLNKNLLPTRNQELSIGTVVSVESLDDTASPSEHYDAILQANEVLRQRATTLPGPVAGLHWFNDRLYAVASVVKTPNSDGYEVNDTHERGPVLKVQGGNMYIGTAVRSAEDVTSDVASLYQSRTEQQAKDELGDAQEYGWEFVHQGWVVPFINGISLYGGLTALNQNRTGVGAQGPTSIAGNKGKPLSATQKGSITNLPLQVNGWKTSDSRTTYNLDVNALNEEDNWSIYADAFISWDRTSSAPVLGPLVEYSPTASVEVEV